MMGSFKPLAHDEPPKPSHHSRFIPREEIGGFSSWTFGSMDEKAPEATPVDEEAIRAAELETQRRLEEAVREGRQQAYAEGYAQGHEVGSRETRESLEMAIRKTAEQAGVRLGQVIQTVSDQLRRAEESIGHEILEIAIDLARQVIRQELATDKEAIYPVVIEALSQLIDDGLPTTIRLNPVDLALMKGSLEEALVRRPIELIADPSITPGGCVVESPSTSVDATIEKRWMRAIGNLGFDKPWTPESEPEAGVGSATGTATGAPEDE